MIAYIYAIMAPVRNISRVIFTVVATGMILLLAGAFSSHQGKDTHIAVKLKKDGNAPHLQKKPIFKRRLNIEGGPAFAGIDFVRRVMGDFCLDSVAAVFDLSRVYPTLRGPPAVV